MTTLVLVPGAWGGSWSWHRVTPLLRGAGHDVYPVTLTGLGERRHLATPEIGLSTHIQDVVNVLGYDDLSDVVLVGHSYAGIVIAGVADRVPARLAQLVYLDTGFYFDPGRSFLDQHAHAARWRERIATEGDGWKMPPPALKIGWLGITDEAELTWVRARLAPQPARTLEDPLLLTRSGQPPIPDTYVVCTAQRTPEDVAAQEAGARQRGYRIRTLASAHAPMSTHPRELVALLCDIAAPSDQSAATAR